MKRTIQLAVLSALALSLAGVLFALQAPLGARAQAEGCSPVTLEGDYIWAYDGATLDGDTSTPYAYAGRESYAGDGTMTGVYSGSYGGEVFRGVAYTGTYTLEADCTGTLATTDVGGDETLSYDIFVDPATGDFYFVAVDEGEVTQGLNRKVQ